MHPLALPVCYCLAERTANSLDRQPASCPPRSLLKESTFATWCIWADCSLTKAVPHSPLTNANALTDPERRPFPGRPRSSKREFEFSEKSAKAHRSLRYRELAPLLPGRTVCGTCLRYLQQYSPIFPAGYRKVRLVWANEADLGDFTMLWHCSTGNFRKFGLSVIP